MAAKKAEIPPVAKPKPVPVKEIIRLLGQMAYNRIEAEKPPKKRPIQLSLRLRRVFADYKRAQRIQKRSQASLKRAGLSVGYNNTLVRESDGSPNWYTRQQDRRRAVADLKTKALIDTIGMSPEGTRDYLLALDAKLRKI